MSAAEKLKALQPVHLTVKAGAEDPYAVGAVTLYNVPLPQIVAVVEAAEKIAELQTEALRVIRENGFVFESIGKEPGNWQHLAFTLYTNLCEVESFTSPALAALDEALEHVSLEVAG